MFLIILSLVYETIFLTMKTNHNTILPIISFGQASIVFEKNFGGGVQGSNHDEDFQLNKQLMGVT